MISLAFALICNWFSINICVRSILPRLRDMFRLSPPHIHFSIENGWNCIDIIMQFSLWTRNYGIFTFDWRLWICLVIVTSIEMRSLSYSIAQFTSILNCNVVHVNYKLNRPGFEMFFFMSFTSSVSSSSFDRRPSFIIIVHSDIVHRCSYTTNLSCVV